MYNILLFIFRKDYIRIGIKISLIMRKHVNGTGKDTKAGRAGNQQSNFCLMGSLFSPVLHLRQVNGWTCVESVLTITKALPCMSVTEWLPHAGLIHSLLSGVWDQPPCQQEVMSLRQLIAGQTPIQPAEAWSMQGKPCFPPVCSCTPFSHTHTHKTMLQGTIEQSSWTSRPQSSPA